MCDSHREPGSTGNGAESPIDRRTLLRSLGAGALGVGLAGCTGDNPLETDPDGESDDVDDSPDDGGQGEDEGHGKDKDEDGGHGKDKGEDAGQDEDEGKGEDEGGNEDEGEDEDEDEGEGEDGWPDPDEIDELPCIGTTHVGTEEGEGVCEYVVMGARGNCPTDNPAGQRFFLRCEDGRCPIDVGFVVVDTNSDDEGADDPCVLQISATRGGCKDVEGAEPVVEYTEDWADDGDEGEDGDDGKNEGEDGDDGENEGEERCDASVEVEAVKSDRCHEGQTAVRITVRSEHGIDDISFGGFSYSGGGQEEVSFELTDPNGTLLCLPHHHTFDFRIELGDEQCEEPVEIEDVEIDFDEDEDDE